MMDFFSNHLESIITLILGFIGGGLTFKLTCKKDSNKSNQYDGINTGGGDFAGRDMHKNT